MPDLDKILKMSEIFGVSTDTLLKEEMELNERKTTFEDLQNEQMKTDTSGMTNFCSNQNSTQQQFGEDTRSEEMGKTQSPVDRIRNVSVYIISGMAFIAWRNGRI